MRPCVKAGTPCKYLRITPIFTECKLKRNYHECDPPAAWFLQAERKEVEE